MTSSAGNQSHRHVEYLGGGGGNSLSGGGNGGSGIVIVKYRYQ